MASYYVFTDYNGVQKSITERQQENLQKYENETTCFYIIHESGEI